ncbi:MAG: hypothetical protein JNK82_15655 [Myxococcaceae bacterium]|nr:hypothetical protein [Myxococcaceae bacterium]
MGRCVDRLEALLPQREDTEVLLDFLEDDLREGFEAAAEVQAHFRQVLETLDSPNLSPAALVEAGEDFRILNRLEYLHVTVTQLRKRLSMAAGKLRGSPFER